MNVELRTLIRRERQTMGLQSTLDIEALLRQAPPAPLPAHSEQNLTDLAMDKYRSMEEAGVSSAIILDYCNRLADYEYIDKVCQIKRGKYIRWIRIMNQGEPAQDPLLSNGGFVLSVKFFAKGTNIFCKIGTTTVHYVQIRFNECLVYQRMNENELLSIGYSEILAKAGQNQGVEPTGSPIQRS